MKKDIKADIKIILLLVIMMNIFVFILWALVASRTDETLTKLSGVQQSIEMQISEIPLQCNSWSFVGFCSKICDNDNSKFCINDCIDKF